MIDLVGFQTQRDADRFQTYLRLFGGGKVLENGELEARSVLETENCE